MERLIETALAPGRFVSYDANFSFLSELGTVEHELAKLIPTAPAQAVALYETFLAGCHEKAEEIVAGLGPSEKPSLLERAKARWGARHPGAG